MSFLPVEDLQKIISDNKSGSAELLKKLNDYLSKNLDRINLGELIPYLMNQFTEFPNILNYLHDLEKISHKDYQTLNFFFKNFELKNTQIINRIYKNSLHELKNFKSFITISNSKTLQNFFELFTKDFPGISISICESRPVFEGRIFAENLLKYEIEVKLITEAMIAAEVQNIDAAVIGADSILADGNVVNKVGSKLLAIACKYYNKPFYVLADKSKFAGSVNFPSLQKDKNEIWDSSPGKVEINNYYFEVIEKELITKIFTG